MKNVWIVLGVVCCLLALPLVSATNVDCGWGDSVCTEDELQDEVDHLDDVDDDLQDQISDVSDDVDDLSDDVSNLGDDLDAVEDDVDELQGDVSHLEHNDRHQDRELNSLERENDRQSWAIGYNYYLDGLQNLEITKVTNTIAANNPIWSADKGGASSEWVLRILSELESKLDFKFVHRSEYNALMFWAEGQGYNPDDAEFLSECTAKYGNCNGHYTSEYYLTQ